MRQDAQKRAPKFCTSKRTKKEKTHPEKPEKGKTGCVLGAGGDESGKNRLRTDVRGRHRMQHKPGKLDRIQTSLSTKNPQTMRFSQDLGTRVLAGAEGLEPSARGFGVDVGKHTRERGKGRCHPILAASHKTGGAGLVLPGRGTQGTQTQIDMTDDGINE